MMKYKFMIPYYRGVGVIATKNPIVKEFKWLEIQALSVSELREAVQLGYLVTHRSVSDR